MEIKVAGIEKSQDFISKQYEGQKSTTENIIKINDHLQNDTLQLKREINTLRKEMVEECAKRNEDAQYLRSNMVEISGIPAMENESEAQSIDLVAKVAHLADFRDFDKRQIDVAHRINPKANASVIVLFKHRSFRNNFL